MQHSISPPDALERAPPTLWPLFPQDGARMKLALDACEAENKRLRRLVVGLSEIVLRIAGGSQSRRP